MIDVILETMVQGSKMQQCSDLILLELKFLFSIPDMIQVRGGSEERSDDRRRLRTLRQSKGAPQIKVAPAASGSLYHGRNGSTRYREHTCVTLHTVDSTTGAIISQSVYYIMSVLASFHSVADSSSPILVVARLSQH